MKTLRLFFTSLALAMISAGVFAQSIAIPAGSRGTSYVISQPGAYHLAGKLVMTDRNASAIRIEAEDVTLDLNGHTVTFADGAGGSGHGILASRGNVEVRNGAVVETPSVGVFGSSSGFRVIDVRVSAAGGTGINVTGFGAVVERCTVTHSAYGVSGQGFGLSVTHSHVSHCGSGIAGYAASLIAENEVNNIDGVGISAGPGSLVRDNVVRDCNENQSAYAAGIVARGKTAVRGNVVTNCRGAGVRLEQGGNLVEHNLITDIIGPVSSLRAAVRVQSGSAFVANNRFSGVATPAIIGVYRDGGGNVSF